MNAKAFEVSLVKQFSMLNRMQVEFFVFITPRMKKPTIIRLCDLEKVKILNARTRKGMYIVKDVLRPNLSGNEINAIVKSIPKKYTCRVELIAILDQHTIPSLE